MRKQTRTGVIKTIDLPMTKRQQAIVDREIRNIDGAPLGMLAIEPRLVGNIIRVKVMRKPLTDALNKVFVRFWKHDLELPH